MSGTVRVLKLQVDKQFEEDKNFPKHYKALQSFVGGTFQAVHIKTVGNRAIYANVHEEGKLIGLEANIVIMDLNNNIIDYLMGDILFNVVDTNTGETVSLTDEEVGYIKRIVIFDRGTIFPVFCTRTMFLDQDMSFKY